MASGDWDISKVLHCTREPSAQLSESLGLWLRDNWWEIAQIVSPFNRVPLCHEQRAGGTPPRWPSCTCRRIGLDFYCILALSCQSSLLVLIVFFCRCEFVGISGGSRRGCLLPVACLLEAEVPPFTSHGSPLSFNTSIFNPFGTDFSVSYKARL